MRFTDQVSDRTLIKLMTDGILLAEIQRDRMLRRYDTLILDEAHERSLNIDFLIGYLTELLPRRPDLKVIVTSATIDPQRFAAHFGGAPIVEVSGRTYPVEIRYRPLEPDATDDDEDDPDDPDHDVVHRIAPRDQTEAIIDAVHELDREQPGDVLVFLSGEREIRDTADALRGEQLTQHRGAAALRAAADRRAAEGVRAAHRAAHRAGHQRRRDVADRARHPLRHRPGHGADLALQQAHQGAAAAHRADLAGVGRAACRTVRAAVATASASGSTPNGTSRRGRGSPSPRSCARTSRRCCCRWPRCASATSSDFPFLDPPDRRSVRDGIALLQELGAFDASAAITDVGRRLAQLPVDPRLGRMILQAQHEGCVREVLVIAAALSIPDPRERPSDAEEAARQKHARFADEHSDFIGYLNLWNYMRAQRKELSGNQFRRMCREEFLHYLRIREWQDLVGQLRTIARGIDIVESDVAADPARIHDAVVAGLLGHIGMRDGESREFLGARNARFVLAPGSVLSRRPPRWVVVAELVETSRLFGRIAARIEPEAVERLAAAPRRAHVQRAALGRRARGAAMGYERVTLYGLPLVARRRVGYATVDPGSRPRAVHPARARRGRLADPAPLLRRQRRRSSPSSPRSRSGRAGATCSSATTRSSPSTTRGSRPTVVSARHFDAWWKKARHRTPDLLTLTRDDLLRQESIDESPDEWQAGDLALPVTYRFEPGAEDDGVTVHIPVDVLGRLGGQEFGWQVPALREELVIALIRSLPKELRRNFVPAPDTARAVLRELTPGQEPLLEGVQRELHRRTGVLVPLDAFDLNKLPAHLRVTFAIEDDTGAVIATRQGPRRAAGGAHRAGPRGRRGSGRRRAGA